jgi:hypothetical protein
LLQGSLIHRCLEQVSWTEDYQLNPEVLRTLLGRLDPLGDWVDPCLQEFEQILKSETVGSLLSRVSYQREILPELLGDSGCHSDDLRLEVQTERAFAIFLEGELVKGFIDRLVLVYAGATLVAADLIDYKTDRVTADNLEQRVQYYRPQLNAYRLAVSQFCHLPIEKVFARLLFVRSGVRVDVPIDEQDLERQGRSTPDIPQLSGLKDPDWEPAEPDSVVPYQLQPEPSQSSAEQDSPSQGGDGLENQAPRTEQQLNLWDED